MSVYTVLGEGEVAEFVAPYGVGRVLSLAPVEGGVENTIYRVEAESGLFILTLYERCESHKIEGVLKTVAELSRRGVPCAETLEKPGGGYVSALRSKPAALARFVEGVQYAEPGVVRLRRLGEVLAGLHKAGAELGRELSEVSHMAKTLCPLAEAWAVRISDRSPKIAELLREEARYQREVPEDDLPGGLIHADLFVDNVIFDSRTDEVRALLDFQMAGRGPWLFDLAVLAANASWKIDGLDGDLMRALLSGYRAVRSMDAEELRLLPAYLRRASLRFLCFRLERAADAKGLAVGRLKNPAEQAEKLAYFQKMKF
jgi:homoserine kinase type II